MAWLDIHTHTFHVTGRQTLNPKANVTHHIRNVFIRAFCDTLLLLRLGEYETGYCSTHIMVVPDIIIEELLRKMFRQNWFSFELRLLYPCNANVYKSRRRYVYENRIECGQDAYSIYEFFCRV